MNLIEFPVSKKSCYLAGPMTGYPEFNFPAFMVAARGLRDDGWLVSNPAEHDLEMGFDPKGPAPTPEQMKALQEYDVGQIMAVDAVFVLSGWMKSLGAVAEVALAQWRGIPVTQIEVTQIEVRKDGDSYLFGYGPPVPSIRGMMSHIAGLATQKLHPLKINHPRLKI